LCKVYKPKKGVPVTALNKVSLKFPEKGMVFLLGKSGSGKSTMLNLLGGLDKYDSGEIIIKGVSSKDFKQQYFDSYRNTYVGFIFQEYNILDEFSVGANIALAIELQGRKATDGEINDILKQVDLEGYGSRKPNELSGGQKQRVAIARALVKNPEIIMADEPTGALDSNTGRQIFDTLKKLSKDKLVLIVSHDREFSEQYADRIIELADGCVISDVELEQETEAGEGAETAEENLTFDGDSVEIAQGYHLTAEDTEAINRYIDLHPNERIKLGFKSKKAAGARRFKDTDQSKIVKRDGSEFKLIKSVLPFKSAFKIGASGLKYKKFKLVMTILLSVVAFGLFGLSDTMGAYDHVKVCTNSLIDTQIRYVSLAKSVKEHYVYDDIFGEKEETYWSNYNTGITDEQIKYIEETTGIKMAGVYEPINEVLDLSPYYDEDAEFTKGHYNIYANWLNGFMEINEEKLKSLECTLLAGALPDGSRDEVALSEYVFESFKIGGYFNEDTNTLQKIEKYEDLIGKTLKLGAKAYTVTGIVDTGFNLERYKTLTEEKPNQSRSDRILEFAMMNEFTTEREYGIAAVLMVGDGYVEKLTAKQPSVHAMNGYASFNGDDINIYSGEYLLYLDEIDKDKIIWVDGEKTELKDKEIIATIDSINFYDDIGTSDMSSEELAEYFKNHTFDGNIEDNSGVWTEVGGYKIVGIIDDESYDRIEALAFSDEMVDKMVNRDRSGVYSYAVGRMPEGKADVRELVEFSYDDSGEIRYEIQNAVTYELDTVNQICEVCSKVFLYIGLGFALFASLMLANFIGTSIAYKKQEIGILRAIGARSNDVFKIFFSESFIIAMINFVISCAGVFLLTRAFNFMMRYDVGILISILTFGVRQVALLLLVSLAVAALASFIPVKKIASKKPVDAIRNR
ncbi:MAG: ATP-binding cassette domain-containing protein, partial [Butyrivibrio sp.]|nr:ATP-binding cassette domain-containing protein [Butyrivibrio sp.]